MTSFVVLVSFSILALLGMSLGQLVTPFQICEMQCIDKLQGMITPESQNSFYEGCRQYCFKHAYDDLFPKTTTSPQPVRLSTVTPTYPRPSYFPTQDFFFQSTRKPTTYPTASPRPIVASTYRPQPPSQSGGLVYSTASPSDAQPTVYPSTVQPVFSTRLPTTDHTVKISMPWLP